MARDLALRFAGEIGSIMPSLAWRLANPYAVRAAWGVSLTYCAVDVGTDAYNVTLRGEGPEHVALHVAERGSFHAIASIALPYVAVSQATWLARLAFTRLGAFQWVGPAAVGLLSIPLLPLLIDKSVSDALQRHIFGPLRDALALQTFSESAWRQPRVLKRGVPVQGSTRP